MNILLQMAAVTGGGVLFGMGVFIGLCAMWIILPNGRSSTEAAQENWERQHEQQQKIVNIQSRIAGDICLIARAMCPEKENRPKRDMADRYYNFKAKKEVEDAKGYL